MLLSSCLGAVFCCTVLIGYVFFIKLKSESPNVRGFCLPSDGEGLQELQSHLPSSFLQEVKLEGLVKGHEVCVVCDPPERHVVLLSCHLFISPISNHHIGDFLSKS